MGAVQQEFPRVQGQISKKVITVLKQRITLIFRHKLKRIAKSQWDLYINTLINILLELLLNVDMQVFLSFSGDLFLIVVLPSDEIRPNDGVKFTLSCLSN